MVWGFFGSICSLNISNLFLNAAFCSLLFFIFSTLSKGRHPKPIPQELVFFFLCVEVPHTALITLPCLSPSPLSILFPGSLPNTWAWLIPEASLVFLQGAFPAAPVANHTLAKQRAPPSPCAVVDPGKNNKNSSRITNILPSLPSAELVKKIQDVPILKQEFMGSASLKSTEQKGNFQGALPQP